MLRSLIKAAHTLANHNIKKVLFKAKGKREIYINIHLNASFQSARDFCFQGAKNNLTLTFNVEIIIKVCTYNMRTQNYEMDLYIRMGKQEKQEKHNKLYQQFLFLYLRRLQRKYHIASQPYIS